MLFKLGGDFAHRRTRRIVLVMRASCALAADREEAKG